MCMRARATVLVLVVAALAALELPLVDDIQFQLQRSRRMCHWLARADEQLAGSSAALAMPGFEQLVVVGLC